MTHIINLIEDNGWSLEIVPNPEKCCCCARELMLPWYFCRESENGRCKKCETKANWRSCLSKDTEHEHFQIIVLKNANPG